MSGPGKALLSLAAGAAVLTFGGLLVLRSPALPYNLRELYAGHSPLRSTLGLAAAFYWLFGAPAALAAWLDAGRARAAALPLVVALHAAAAWMLLRWAAPLEALYDIVGTPVLRWPWEWEMLGRFTALLAALTVTWTAGAVLATGALGLTRHPWRALAGLGAAAALLLPVAHWVVVARAATDNLTELMAGGGGPGASALLLLGLLVLGVAGSLLSAVTSIGPGRAILVVTAVIVSIPAAYAAFSLGTEREIEKYGQVFSGLQFVLSRDRTAYAGPSELLVRYAVAHVASVLLIAVAQHPIRIAIDRGSLAGRAQNPDQGEAQRRGRGRGREAEEERS